MKKSMMVLAAILAMAARAAITVPEVNVTYTGNNKNEDWTDQSKWSDGKCPHGWLEGDPVGQEWYYGVFNGKNLRTSGSNNPTTGKNSRIIEAHAFVFGNASSTGVILDKVAQKLGQWNQDSATQWQKLYFVNGYAVHGGNVYTDQPETAWTVDCWHIGEMFVCSTSTAPWYFQCNDWKGRWYRLSGSISGDSSAAFGFRHAPDNNYLLDSAYKPEHYWISTDCDLSDYHGKMIVSYTGTVFRVNAPAQLGAAEDTLMPDALTLEKCGLFGLAADAGYKVVINPENRGITLGAPAGGFFVESGNSMILEMPVAGNNYDAEKYGNGLMVVDGTWSQVKSLTVRDGTVMLGDKAAGVAADQVVLAPKKILPGSSETPRAAFMCTNGTCAAALTLTANCFVAAGGKDTETTFSNLTLAGGGVMVQPFEPTEAPGTVVLGSDCVAGTDPIAIYVSKDIPANTPNGTEWTLVKIPTALRKVTTADFTVETETTLSVEIVVDESDDVQSVKLHFGEMKTMTNRGDSSSSGGLLWDDGTLNTAANPVSQDYNYMVTGNNGLRTVYFEDDVAAGSKKFLPKLTMTGPNAGIYLKSASTRFGNLVLNGGTGIGTYGYTGDPQTQEVTGNVTINGEASAPVTLTPQNQRTLRLNATVKGSGFLCVREFAQGPSLGFVEFAGDMSGFTGKIEFLSGDSDLSQNYVTMVLRDENMFGSEPGTFVYDQIGFHGGTHFVVTNDLTVSSQNRGWSIMDNPTIVVSNGVTFTLNSPIDMTGVLTKLGGGTLAVGGPHAFGLGTASSPSYTEKNILQVKEGAIRPKLYNVFNGYCLKFSDDAALELDLDEQDSLIKANGLYDTYAKEGCPLAAETEDGKIHVKLVGEIPDRSFTVNVCTVHKDFAEALAPKFDFVGIEEDHQVIPSIVIDGAKATIALKCRLPRGFVLMFR